MLEKSDNIAGMQITWMKAWRQISLTLYVSVFMRLAYPFVDVSSLVLSKVLLRCEGWILRGRVETKEMGRCTPSPVHRQNELEGEETCMGEDSWKCVVILE